MGSSLEGVVSLSGVGPSAVRTSGSWIESPAAQTERFYGCLRPSQAPHVSARGGIQRQDVSLPDPGPAGERSSSTRRLFLSVARPHPPGYSVLIVLGLLCISTIYFK
ncbi:hypothetical protein NDU88_006269 [Pleurodeles waltl]|uniref:Uncharacterized protein n=1 Tax=Pleurodeles waltl TaxID=8319 RepID=A0AAV7MCF5_PLEWA|nr:hypothetical protein NDU88_006269 [Pleurodeles waltl]